MDDCAHTNPSIYFNNMVTAMTLNTSPWGCCDPDFVVDVYQTSQTSKQEDDNERGEVQE